MCKPTWIIMSMVGPYFVGFVTPTSSNSGQYWNDETREALRNGFNREVMDDIAFEAAKAEHRANVAHTIALIRRREKVIASVKEAKARSQVAVDVISEAINAIRQVAVLGTMTDYSRKFQHMGLMQCYGLGEEDGSMSISRAKQECDETLGKMNAMRVNHMKAHCQDGLDRRFGENTARLVGDSNGDYMLRVRTSKGWATCILPKLPLFDWRQRIKDTDVAEEIRRIQKK